MQRRLEGNPYNSYLIKLSFVEVSCGEKAF